MAVDLNKPPQAFWALLIAFQGTVIALFVLFAKSSDNIKLAVLAVASSLVSGALGAFAGHALATSNTMATGPNTTINTPPVVPVIPPIVVPEDPTKAGTSPAQPHPATTK